MLNHETEVVTKHVSELKNALTLLYDLQSRELSELKKDQHLVGSAKYHLIIAIESAVDISNHLISKNNYRVPESYSDTFKVMAEKGILPQDLVEEKLTDMARFRNRLVHIYWDIDSEMLYQIIQENLNDLEQFLVEIKKALKKD